MITCPKCSKENQDHYKFCLGCGAELPRDAAPKPFAPRTPPHGMKAVPAQRPAAAPAAAQAPAPASVAVHSVPRPAPAPAPEPAPAPAPAPVAVAAPAPAPASAGGDVSCPQCGHVNSPNFKFCASCGLPLGKAAAAPAPAPAAAPAAAAANPVRLTVLRADGTEAGSYDVPAGNTTVGRDMGGIFGGDNYLSPQHATLSRKGAKVFVKDVGTTNGTYLKLKREAPEPLAAGQMFRIGQEILRFESLATQPAVDGVEHMGSPSAGYVGRIAMVTGRDLTGNAYPLPETGVHIGRERGHILFPEDGYVSGLHCSLTKQGDGGVVLTDLGSSNGTFVRIDDERELHDGDVLLMGQQLFRVNM
ncbi:MAG: FHA domain-containing protein [Deltaproteobacteria bacterium]|nr:FHA domain-containing protein [Deltaproteobacteria bacterium]